jgi:molybdopterin synthase catalytic subunit
VIDTRVQAGDFDPGRQLRRLEELSAGAVAGAAIAVRGDPQVREVLIDHYAALARTVLARIAEDAKERFGLAGIILIHRHGLLSPGDRLAFAAAAAQDQKAAVDGCAYLLEALRTRAPFWRCETREDGSSDWRQRL